MFKQYTSSCLVFLPYVHLELGKIDFVLCVFDFRHGTHFSYIEANLTMVMISVSQQVCVCVCAVRSFQVCRKTFLGPHFYYSFVKNEEILVAISKIKLFF